jgi:phosphoribosyl 1,2-cyclic phosphate phosphodiesterase
MKSSVKLCVLGCGGSLGVPNVAGRAGVCDMRNPKNFRTRTSAWVAYNGKNFLIDTSPDLRTQLLRENLTGIRPDAVLYTHSHADHCHGMEELRAYYWTDETRVDIYAHAAHMADLEVRFDYLFRGAGNQDLYRPIVAPHLITAGTHTIAGQEIRSIEMPHGGTPCMGYRFGPVAWTTDFKTIPAEGLAALQGIKVWFAAVADWDRPHPAHAILPEVLELCEQLGNPRTYLIHLNPRFDFDALDAVTPPHVTPAYDGLIVELE